MITERRPWKRARHRGANLAPSSIANAACATRSTGILKRLMAIEQSSNASAGLKTALASVATIVTALAGTLGKKFEMGPMDFDVAALTAVLTTVSGAIFAHIEASRYQHLIMRYSAARLGLEDPNTEFEAASGDAGSWSGFVNRCKDIIAAENNSWVAKWIKAPAG